MVRTKELVVMTFLFLPFSLLMHFIFKFFNKPVTSNHVTISSAKPCKQSEIIITFASTRHALSNSSWALDLPSRDYCPVGKPHFSEINPLMLIWQQHKAKSKPPFSFYLSHLSHQWCWQRKSQTCGVHL